jgi:hypothetical protein
MLLDLAALRRTDFEPHLNTPFSVAGEQGDVELSLCAVDPLAKHPGHTREPFALVFRGSAERVLAQGTHALEHDALGTLEIFLVPIGPDGEGMRYEAVFS